MLSIVYRWQGVKVEHRADEDDDRHHYDDAAHHLVDYLNAVGVENRTDLVYEPCQSIPPQHRTADNADISGTHLGWMVGDYECKLGEESHHEHYDERIGERDEECRDAVVDERALGATVAYVNFLHRVASERIDSEYHEDDTGRNLQYVPIVGIADEVHDERHSKTRYKGVYEIADTGADACHETEPSAFVECALNAKHSYRAHRG